MEAELIVPQKLDTGDTVKMKQAMDEAVIKAVLDMGYMEDHTLSNAKLSIMALACVFALVAQFWPHPFPESRPLLAICCVSYFACSMVLHLIVTYWERDLVLTTAKNGEEGVRRGMLVRTDFPRFSDQYTVSVEERKKNAKPVEDVWSVGKFFDVEGHFDEWGMGEVAVKLVQRLEKKVDSKEKKKVDSKEKKKEKKEKKKEKTESKKAK